MEGAVVCLAGLLWPSGAFLRPERGGQASSPFAFVWVREQRAGRLGKVRDFPLSLVVLAKGAPGREIVPLGTCVHWTKSRCAKSPMVHNQSKEAI